MKSKKENKRSTLEVSKGTQEMTKLYCTLKRITIKEFVDKVINKELKNFKKTKLMKIRL